MEATKDTKVEGDFSAEGDDAFSSTSRSFDFYHNLSERQHRTLAEKTPPGQQSQKTLEKDSTVSSGLPWRREHGERKKEWIIYIYSKE